jgi:AbrB family looped-hinge helix DNA binding protein
MPFINVTLKPKTDITVPKGIRRKAGIKSGDEFEFTVSGRVINIVPKLLPDEAQDEQEVGDSMIRAAIGRNYQELAAKAAPLRTSSPNARRGSSDLYNRFAIAPARAITGFPRAQAFPL